MLHLLGIIFIFFVVALLVGAGIILGLLRRLFGLGGKQARNARQESGQASATAGRQTYRYDDGQWVRQHGGTRTQDNAVTPEEGELHINPKKIFGKDEGEYVDFEEVKE